MTPRIPRGWAQATERGEGVYCCDDDEGDRPHYIVADHKPGPLAAGMTYIRRTDPAVPADPNEALRLEDEAARVAPDAEPMVPGMMTIEGIHVALASIECIAEDAVWHPDETNRKDGRTTDELLAAYTAAWEYTERRRAEIAEEVRRADEPPAPDLGEWPGKVDVPPGTPRSVQIETPHGWIVGWYCGAEWWTHPDPSKGAMTIDPRDVLRWRELPRAVVEDGRVTGVRRG